MNNKNKSTNWITWSVKGSHSAALLVSLGRNLPSIKAHAKYLNYIDVIGYDDVALIENMYAVKLITKPTKSGYWLRIVNQSEVIAAIKCYLKNQ